MTMPGDMPASSGWTVTGQTEGTEPGPDGQLTRGMTVYARTGNGTQISVFVPMTMYDPATVRTMLAEKAAAADAIAGLSAPPAS